MRKFLFVGLGGSGGKTLRFLRHDIDRWLKSIGHDHFPTGWQFLHIDTPTVQDGLEVTDVPMLPAESYVGLVAGSTTLETVVTKLDTTGGESNRDLATWRVDSAFLNVPITVGAGQFRAVGRAIGLSHVAAISGAIRTSFARLNSADANAELTEVQQRAFGDTSNSPVANPVIVVVSSLAGGSGAGLLLDVCDIIRQQGPGSRDIFGILYAADVFRDLGSLGAGGIQPNSMAAISEIINGYLLNANNPRLNTFFESGQAPHPVTRSGPSYPFLVGASNTKGVQFGDQVSSYAMMGRALKSWVTDPAVQGRLLSYTIAQWESACIDNKVKADILSLNLPPIFEAYGHAEVTLGTDRFNDYSSQRLARAAAEWLHEAHLRLALAEDPNDSRPPSEIIDSFARDQYVSTLKIAGLLERGEDNNQVIDALKPQDFETLWIEAKNDAERLATQGIGSMNSIQWAARLDETLPMVATQFGDAHDVGVREKAKAWTEKMPERILSVATDLARRFGIRVAARTLELVAEEMIQNAEELEDEANQFESRSDRSSMRATVLAELPPSGNFPGSHPGVSKAVEHGLWCSAGYLSEAKKRRIASQLLIEMANGFVTPLAAGLGRSYEELNLRGFVGEGNRAPIVERWPQVSVPDSLVPPPNEFLVIEIDEFVGTFDRLVQRSTKSTNKHDCFNEARGEIITGGFLDTDAVAAEIAKPIQILQKWSPSPSLLIGANSDKSNATFQFNFDAMSLLERAQAWISRPGTSFEKFINADLRGFLTESNECSVQEMSARQSRFQSAFSAALDASEPLVDVDEHLRSIVHGGARHRRIVTSALPFKNHSLEGHVRSILHSRLGAEEGSRVSEQISDTSTARGIKSIAISSHLGAPHDPIVFRSVTTPMIVGWASAQGSASAVGFWKYRRARPIREFVPVSQEVLVCMTRGWFTARLLGLVDWSTRQISDPDRPTPAKFPSRLLTEPSTHRDWLPALLESIMLANCEAANLGDVESLRAYVRLRNLGAQPGTTDFHQSHSYRRLNESLEGWLTSGEATGALVEGILVKAANEELGQRPTAGARSELLKAKLQETFDSYKNDYRSYLAEASHSPERLGANFELWPGMADVILAGLEDLIQAASRHQAASSELM